MGCLFLPFEWLLESILDGWFCLMQWIVPSKKLGKGTRAFLKILAFIFSLIFFVSMVLGGLAFISDNQFTHQMGKYLLFIPLGISAVQIIFGIIIRYIEKHKSED